MSLLKRINERERTALVAARTRGCVCGDEWLISHDDEHERACPLWRAPWLRRGAFNKDHTHRP